VNSLESNRFVDNLRSDRQNNSTNCKSRFDLIFNCQSYKPRFVLECPTIIKAFFSRLESSTSCKSLLTIIRPLLSSLWIIVSRKGQIIRTNKIKIFVYWSCKRTNSQTDDDFFKSRLLDYPIYLLFRWTFGRKFCVHRFFFIDSYLTRIIASSIVGNGVLGSFGENEY